MFDYSDLREAFRVVVTPEGKFASAIDGVIHLGFPISVDEALCGARVRFGLGTSVEDIIAFIPEQDGGLNYCVKCVTQVIDEPIEVITSWKG